MNPSRSRSLLNPQVRSDALDQYPLDRHPTSRPCSSPLMRLLKRLHMAILPRSRLVGLDTSSLRLTRLNMTNSRFHGCERRTLRDRSWAPPEHILWPLSCAWPFSNSIIVASSSPNSLRPHLSDEAHKPAAGKCSRISCSKHSGYESGMHTAAENLFRLGVFPWRW